MFDAQTLRSCSSLLGFNALTGFDQTGKFCGYGKPSCWKVLINSPKKVSNSLWSLGEQDIIDNVKNRLEQFILDLYCKERPAEVNLHPYVGTYFLGNFSEEILA